MIVLILHDLHCEICGVDLNQEQDEDSIAFPDGAGGIMGLCKKCLKNFPRYRPKIENPETEVYD